MSTVTKGLVDPKISINFDEGNHTTIGGVSRFRPRFRAHTLLLLLPRTPSESNVDVNIITVKWETWIRRFEPLRYPRHGLDDQTGPFSDPFQQQKHDTVKQSKARRNSLH
jgi:hypothetical protein